MAFTFELQSRFVYGLQKEVSEVTAILSCSQLKRKYPREELWRIAQYSSHFTQFFLKP